MCKLQSHKKVWRALETLQCSSLPRLYLCCCFTREKNVWFKFSTVSVHKKVPGNLIQINFDCCITSFFANMYKCLEIQVQAGYIILPSLPMYERSTYIVCLIHCCFGNCKRVVLQLRVSAFFSCRGRHTCGEICNSGWRI